MDESGAATAQYPEFLSAIARQGSGSACRSMYGGFVRWQKGDGRDTSAANYDGSDSHAIPVKPASHWPDLHMLILVANAKKKKVSSTNGMQASVATSPLLAHRAQSVVNPRLAEMEKACADKDFDTFARLTMMDSNQFHATCLDTYPPIFYLSEVSHTVIALVHAYNQWSELEADPNAQNGGGTLKNLRAAYTFDAGPNAVLFVRKQHLHQLFALVLYFFPASDGTTSFVNHSNLYDEMHQQEQRGGDGALLPPRLIELASAAIGAQGCARGLVKRIIHSSIGEGPQIVPLKDALLNPNTGFPVPVPSAEGEDKGGGRNGASRAKMLLAGFLIAAGLSAAM